MAPHPAGRPRRCANRGHLSTAQRAAIAAELANMKVGDNQHSSEQGPPNGGRSLIPEKRAAEIMNVGQRSVSRAKQRMKSDPAAHEAVKRGEEPALNCQPDFTELKLNRLPV